MDLLSNLVRRENSNTEETKEHNIIFRNPSSTMFTSEDYYNTDCRGQDKYFSDESFPFNKLTVDQKTQTFQKQKSTLDIAFDGIIGKFFLINIYRPLYNVG